MQSNDISNKTILLCFVRFNFEYYLKEKFIRSLDFPGKTTVSEVFIVLNDDIELELLKR